ncbi:hypothetical protein RFI_13974 [Reticulomyxa filosa]|uniref:Uncharacterized protein n=1 Tax=Reticulomyxa filosa TaxID=46433 RepID=X6NA85_RETFI|nr:hypothetical protein RFI_13974 [Reticulomyxa filosa]|eukprot:ETO23210.1 hypothetical protein RFI_13974 [Reticulomyxa filosa]
MFGEKKKTKLCVYNDENNFNKNQSIVSSEAEELTVNQENRYSSKQPRIRKIGVGDDGFEEYDIDFSDAHTMSDHGQRHRDEEEEEEEEEENENENEEDEDAKKRGDEEEYDVVEKKENPHTQKLRHQLLEEQLRVEELKHERRKSVLEVEAYQQELFKIKKMTLQQFASYKAQNIQLFGNVSNTPNLPESPGASQNIVTACANCEELRRCTNDLQQKLEKAYADVDRLTRERRNSLAKMSERTFKQMLDQEKEHYNEKDQLYAVIQELNTLNTRLTDEKCFLLQTACQTIDHLRFVIFVLFSSLLSLLPYFQCQFVIDL